MHVRVRALLLAVDPPAADWQGAGHCPVGAAPVPLPASTSQVPARFLVLKTGQTGGWWQKATEETAACCTQGLSSCFSRDGRIK